MKPRIWDRGDLRLLVVGLAFVVAWVAIGYRLFDLQGTQAVALAGVGYDQRIQTRTIEPPRGTIYDRDGVEMAMTVDGWNVVVDPQLIEDPTAAAVVFAPYTDTDVATLAAELKDARDTGSRYVEIVARVRVSEKAVIAAAVDEADIGGVFYRKQPLRVYPAGSIAAQIIGLTRNDDGVGLEGLERTFNSELEGDAGELIVERDPYGRVIPQGDTRLTPAVPGSNIVTTIDREIQFAAEQALEKRIAETSARSGSIVVLAPKTGEVLAMASWPGFDLNDRATATPEALRNRAVADIYEPGSTLKAVTIAAAIDEGVVTVDTRIDTPPSVTVGEFEYKDHGRNRPSLTVADVVKRSSNVGTIEIERRLGPELHYKYLTAFGLGAPAGLDVEGERHGSLDPPSSWTVTSGSSIAIGYAIGTTALQMAAVYATIANDGIWTEPFLVSQILQADGSRILTKPRTRRVLSSETAATMRWMLGRVVEEDGTGRRARMTDYTAGGKTGTSQKFDSDLGVYTEDTYASFIGMAPLNDPEVVVVIVLDTPTGQLEDGTDLSLGGAAAAPVFAELTQTALHQLGIAPDKE